MNKNIKIALNSITLGLIVLPVSVLAYYAPSEPGSTGTNVESIVGNVVDKVWIIFAAIAVILFVYSGVKFLTAGGAPEKVQEARQAAMWGVVGVVVMILAFSIFDIATNLIR
jgi:uncharacterized membrane protein YjfL (UPF0719 family)